MLSKVLYISLLELEKLNYNPTAIRLQQTLIFCSENSFIHLFLILIFFRNDSLKISSKGEIQWSRYSNEFEELEYVAKGGFGQVYKAQHKLDGGIYAVKKIYLRWFFYYFTLIWHEINLVYLWPIKWRTVVTIKGVVTIW